MPCRAIRVKHADRKSQVHFITGARSRRAETASDIRGAAAEGYSRAHRHSEGVNPAATFQFPNGGTGFWGVKTGSADVFSRPVIAQSQTAYLRYTVVFVTLGFLLIEMHRRLAPGRAWALIRRSEAAAMAAGVNVTLYKTWAFGISGLLAGISGALLAGSLGLLDDGTFRASESIMLFALAVVGGARYWLGCVIAAALYRILPALLNNWGVDADLSFVIFGAGLLHAVITAPDGIAGQIMAAFGKRKAVADD